MLKTWKKEFGLFWSYHINTSPVTLAMWVFFTLIGIAQLNIFSICFNIMWYFGLYYSMNSKLYEEIIDTIIKSNKISQEDLIKLINKTNTKTNEKK